LGKIYSEDCPGEENFEKMHRMWEALNLICMITKLSI